MKNSLSDLLTGFQEVTSALTTDPDLKEDFQGLKEEMTNIQKDLQTLGNDITGEVKTFLGELQTDFQDLDLDFQGLKNAVKSEIVNPLDVTLSNGLNALTPEEYAQYLLPDGVEPNLGDHLFCERPNYTHHGVYSGKGQVLNYRGGEIRYDEMSEFLLDSPLYVLPESESPCNYEPEEILYRGRSRLGENRYNLIFNNCEHFARWCRNGEPLEQMPVSYQ